MQHASPRQVFGEDMVTGELFADPTAYENCEGLHCSICSPLLELLLQSEQLGFECLNLCLGGRGHVPLCVS